MTAHITDLDRVTAAADDCRDAAFEAMRTFHSEPTAIVHALLAIEGRLNEICHRLYDLNDKT